MASRLQILILLSVIVLSVSEGALAVSKIVEAKTSDYLIKKWTTEEGLPQNTVTSIVQTSDGYIWLGTFGGLARFDGVRFTVFDSINAPSLKSNRILSLYEDKWKRLWIGTETGEVYSFHSNTFTEFQPFPGGKRLTVWQFLEDGQGGFYISSDAGLEKVTFDEKGAVIPGSELVLTKAHSYKLAKSNDGQVWTLVEGTAFAVEGDTLVSAASRGLILPKDLQKIDVQDDGTKTVISMTGLGSIDDGKYREILPLDPKFHLTSLTTSSRRNELWFQQVDELYELHTGQAIKRDIGEYVTGGSRAIFFDNEDNIWLATNADGLVRLSRKKIDLLSDLGGFETVDSYCIAEAPDGTVWVGGLDLLKVNGGKVERVKRPMIGADYQLVKALAFDRDGAMWIGGSGGLSVMRNGEITPIPSFGTRLVHSIFFDRDSVMWGGGPDGLWNFRDSKFTHYTTNDGLVGNSIHYITQTKDGTIWIGTKNGITKLRNGRFENFSSDHGLSGEFVRDIVEDGDGTMWIGTYGGGINRIHDGKVTAITTVHGLLDNFVSRILVDNDGKFWILGNLGIFSVNRDDLNSVADGRKSKLVGSVFGVADGMKSSEASGGHQPAGTKTRDGRLWFPMIKDVVTIDPKVGNKTPPKVLIEGASTRSDDARSLPATLDIREGDSISIPTGQRDLEIQFTGLSFTKPEGIRFYYRLDELDNDWTDAGFRRKAFYPYLPAGNYTFHVRAVNAMGIMSENTATLRISVDKPFWRTWWFLLLTLTGAMFAGFLLYRFKMEQIKAERLKEIEVSKQLLSAQEVERERIASELHDGLGQNLLILSNWAQLGLDATDDPVEVREHLLQISETAAQSIDETRAIVRNLSPRNLKRFGLTEAIRNMIEQLHGSTGVVFESKIDNIDRLYSAESELSIYRIVQECLNNVIKHSESPRGRVSITRSSDGLEIVIEDYGKGFAAQDYREYGETKRGFGVHSIVQRVRLLGGDINFESRPSEGTTIQIRLKK